MADFALLVGERRMRKLRHQLGHSRLVRIMAGHTVGGFEGLVLVRLLQVGVLYIVAIDAKRRWRLGQMKIKLGLAEFSGLVGNVASLATHIEGRVPAALLRNVHPNLVATEAKIFFLISRLGLQQLIFIVRGVRIVALHTISYRRRMNRALDVGGILIRVAG